MSKIENFLKGQTVESIKIPFLSKILPKNTTPMTLTGLSTEQWAIFFKDKSLSSDITSKNLFLLPTVNEAEEFFDNIKEIGNVYYYPDIGSDIYSSIIPSEFNLVKRISIISKVLDSDQITIVSSLQSALLFTPPTNFFLGHKISLAVSDVISPAELSQRLIEIGYNSGPSIEEPGSFSSKGEIFDIFPINEDPVRLIYFDDMIEEIFPIDLTSLRSIKDQSLNSIALSGSQHTFLDKTNVNIFRNRFPRPKLNEKEKFEYRNLILKKLSNQNFFEDYPLFTSYFFEETATLFNYLEEFKVFFINKENIEFELNKLKEDLSQSYNIFQKDADLIKPEPDEIYNFAIPKVDNLVYVNDINYDINLNSDIEHYTEVTVNPLNVVSASSSQQKYLKSLLELIKEYNSKNYICRVYYTKVDSLKEIEYLIREFVTDNLTNIHFIPLYLKKGFIYHQEKILFLSETDFFSQKVKKTSSKKTNFDSDVFAEQISTLKENDFVIHKDYGVGKYLGIESLKLSENTSDYLVIEYKDKDKVYVPVYKIHLVQKHSSSTASVPLANLKTKTFESAKVKAKKAVKKLAFDLLEIQAKRKMKKGFSFSEPDHEFNEFCLSFKFTETPDQITAIEDVISDMTSERPMDRLVCGDVGFGKTEVAIRAAYKAVLDGKQVCVLVPTTVLALQHFNSFQERFKNTAVQIDFISRFKTATQLNDTIQNLASGKIDIIIGTHKILSSKVKFSDLGLLVIDEEQRFGVGHKEKLKLIKENVDTLTLTATPIPRTLQMSFLGIKDLSIIKTPPTRRQSIKSYVIKEDLPTIRNAINRELARGGQIFIVHNKVNDIEIFSSKIRELVPEARIIFAHGQLPERELEKRISDFYKYKYDILIATTIIESGIDIPRANTMIIDRADTYGLSQLHQLRGRIGRSDKKAYAYFMVPSHKKLSDIASKRLKALQTYADLGSGYSLATSDLEIRGSGDILGPEQSGHIGNIGLELYMELLKECIEELSGTQTHTNKNIEIQTPFNAILPSKYIEDTGTRLKFYKKISNSNSVEDLSDVKGLITDQYGQLPIEAENLISLIFVRLNLSKLAISFVKVGQQNILLNFNKAEIESNETLRNKIINLFTQRPKIYKINPDYSINCKFKDKIKIEILIEFSKYLKEQLDINDK